MRFLTYASTSEPVLSCSGANVGAARNWLARQAGWSPTNLLVDTPLTGTALAFSSTAPVASDWYQRIRQHHCIPRYQSSWWKEGEGGHDEHLQSAPRWPAEQAILLPLPYHGSMSRLRTTSFVDEVAEKAQAAAAASAARAVGVAGEDVASGLTVTETADGTKVRGTLWFPAPLGLMRGC